MGSEGAVADQAAAYLHASAWDVTAWIILTNTRGLRAGDTPRCWPPSSARDDVGPSLWSVYRLDLGIAGSALGAVFTQSMRVRLASPAFRSRAMIRRGCPLCALRSERTQVPRSESRTFIATGLANAIGEEQSGTDQQITPTQPTSPVGTASRPPTRVASQTLSTCNLNCYAGTVACK